MIQPQINPSRAEKSAYDIIFDTILPKLAIFDPRLKSELVLMQVRFSVVSTV